MYTSSFKKVSLSQEILQALSRLNYHQPTLVQAKVIPNILKKKDMIVKSQTGSGKTAAFGIPICELVDWEENKPQALILTPTRELAAQIKEDITNIGRFKRIKATVIYGKQPFDRQKNELKQKSHVVVGTPGRVLDHINKGTLVLERIQYFVIDEADEMLNRGFIEQVEAIMAKLPENRVTLLFSATIPESIKQLCQRYMNEPIDIEIEQEDVTTNRIQHKYYEIKGEEKFCLLKNILTIENPDSCIIFCRTQEQVNTLFQGLKRLNYPCQKIHGGLSQEERFHVMKEFKLGKFRYLVATDIAARGIDVDNISLVMNYDIPLEKESYVHRTGRTGRAGKKGLAITFVTPREKPILEEIQDYIGFKLKKESIPTRQDVLKHQASFQKTLSETPKLKRDKSESLNQDIMKLYFNGGKKKKLRAVDFVGTIAKLEGVTADDIGIITIQETSTYVDILNGKGPIVLNAMKETKVKGKQLKVYEARQ
ncbi:DEAD/DEAH box helicase [Terrilactibacillus sp. BCM23-1]|uniref:ATP-dependent RNA helicase DbpA n=1 Tax=Terrilactibacillus tamarindi TaxID=2599694 RepID=A0A6N8CTJ4_9BACI|nr:DEAD/DEAH box helicase [Terrilactibacillus tamarindi]MTT31306.1 DEAD/DEAH box helicase [Terrilactibacillus tamarindi]